MKWLRSILRWEVDVDERFMKSCIGNPVPEVDMARRLPIDRPVGPDIYDTGTVFAINSTYMDVTEPSLMEKHWFITGIVIGIAGMSVGPYIYMLAHTGPRDPEGWVMASNCLALIALVGFGRLTWKVASGLISGLRHRPIRFHRTERKLYAIRKRRFFAKPGEGDVVWEAPWTKDSIFCLHRERSTFGNVFHIRHYTTDEQGKVTRVFSIGREWMSEGEVEMLLGQWNYWCKYMNDGPRDLPKPMLFHTQNETPRESFLYSLYGIGLNAPVIVRLIMAPFIAVFTVMRIVANATCRNPIWPEAIEKISRIAPDDNYAEPRSSTPVGWAETVLAQQRGEYPDDPYAKVPDWKGESSGKANAALWLKNPRAVSLANT